jgi:hypothetical protein
LYCRQSNWSFCFKRKRFLCKLKWQQRNGSQLPVGFDDECYMDWSDHIFHNLFNPGIWEWCYVATKTTQLRIKQETIIFIWIYPRMISEEYQSMIGHGLLTITPDMGVCLPVLWVNVNSDIRFSTPLKDPDVERLHVFC